MACAEHRILYVGRKESNVFYLKAESPQSDKHGARGTVHGSGFSQPAVFFWDEFSSSSLYYLGQKETRV